MHKHTCPQQVYCFTILFLFQPTWSAPLSTPSLLQDDTVTLTGTLWYMPDSNLGRWPHVSLRKATELYAWALKGGEGWMRAGQLLWPAAISDSTGSDLRHRFCRHLRLFCFDLSTGKSSLISPPCPEDFLFFHQYCTYSCRLLFSF